MESRKNKTLNDRLIEWQNMYRQYSTKCLELIERRLGEYLAKYPEAQKIIDETCILIGCLEVIQKQLYIIDSLLSPFSSSSSTFKHYHNISFFDSDRSYM